MLNLDLLKAMSYSHVHDYVIPGLTSSLIGGNGHGMVRMFSCEREHEEPITPHSHRFDFQCLVLDGSVRNRIWTQVPIMMEEKGDLYQQTILEHHGNFGDQTKEVKKEISRWMYTENKWIRGQLYWMKSSQIHSIYFSRGARVLFFEGPAYSMKSSMLEPVSGGRVIPTFRVDPWMFRKEDGEAQS